MVELLLFYAFHIPPPHAYNKRKKESNILRADSYKFAVTGGDMRQVYLAEILAGRGCRVMTYALCDGRTVPGVRNAESLKKLMKSADVIVGAVPLLRAGALTGADQADDFTLDGLIDGMEKGKLFFAGCIPADFRKKAEGSGAELFDLMQHKKLAVKNTAAAAEGILAEAISRSPRNLSRSRCLVLGYGKCGSTLTAYLKNWFGGVTGWETKVEAGARAAILADQVVTPDELGRVLPEMDFIFNTAPDVVLKGKLLDGVRKDALILDMATVPGGVDYARAKSLGLHAVLLPGLPGRYAPLTSAEIIADSVFELLKENLQQ